jgi:hypothetical protein
MAIDIQAEELIELGKVPANLERRTGKRLNLSTVYRWSQRGIAGIQLETILVGGCRYTSAQALNRFFTQSTLAKQGKLSKATTEGIRRAKDIRQKQVEARAKRLGI